MMRVWTCDNENMIPHLRGEIESQIKVIITPYMMKIYMTHACTHIPLAKFDC